MLKLILQIGLLCALSNQICAQPSDTLPGAAVLVASSQITSSSSASLVSTSSKHSLSTFSTVSTSTNSKHSSTKPKSSSTSTKSTSASSRKTSSTKKSSHTVSSCPSTTSSPPGTVTLTTTSLQASPTETLTFQSFVYTTTTTLSLPSSYTYSITYTSTLTYQAGSQTFAQYTTLSAPSTTTVTSACGFTPVLSESAYRATKVATSTETEVYYPDATVTKTITTASTVTSYGTTSTYASIAFTTHTYPDVTVSSTVAPEAVHTAYQACQKNNLVDYYPGNYIVNVVYFPYGLDTIYLTTNGNSEQCCSFCQSNSTCVGSIQTVSTRGVTTPSSSDCQLFVNSSAPAGTCSQKSSAVQFGTTGSKRKASDTVYQVVSNGPCGEMVPNLELPLY